MKGGIQRKGVIAKMQRIKLNSMRFQTKRRCLFVISGLMHLTQKLWRKVETKGESCKNVVITTAETKIEIFYK